MARSRRELKRGRVLLVSEYFLPHWTGISQAFYYLAKNLQQQGYGVRVLTTQFDPKLPREEKLNDIDVIRAPYQLRISRTHYSFALLITFIRMLPKYDWVVVNSPNSNILFLSILTRCFGKKLAVYHQGDLTLPRQTGSVFANALMELIFDILTIPSMFLAQITSTFTKDYAQTSRVMRYRLKTFRPYIPALALSTEAPSRKFERKMDDLKKNAALIGLAGRFVEEKGFDILLKAIPLVVKAYPNARFVFAGAQKLDYEPFYEKYQPLIEAQKGHLDFLGLLHKGDLAHFYKMLDVFVIASRSECLALTQIEAIKCNVPVVVTNTPGARMIVKESGFGVIVNKEDVNDLARGIIDTIRNRRILIRKRKNALTFLKKNENFKLD